MAAQPSAYRAILRGSQLIWIDSPPDLPVNAEVRATIQSAPQARSRGALMAAALEKLAQRSAFEGVDPVAWQRETRQDKPLYGRE